METLEREGQEPCGFSADLVRQLAPGVSFTADLVDIILASVELDTDAVFIGTTLYPKLKDDVHDDDRVRAAGLPRTEWRMPIYEDGGWAAAMVVWGDATIRYYDPVKSGRRNRRKSVVKVSNPTPFPQFLQGGGPFLVPNPASNFHRKKPILTLNHGWLDSPKLGTTIGGFSYSPRLGD